MATVRPYLAVVFDSFHAALASRVLWAAMVAIWLLLLSLAPVGIREDYTTSFRWFDVYNGTRMKAMLAQGLVDPAKQDQALGKMARAMPDELRRKLRQVGEGREVRIYLPILTEALNELIDRDVAAGVEPPDWYSPEAWQGTLRFRELRQLDEADGQTLSESLRRRRARLRIEAALPGVFESRGRRSVTLTYAGLSFPTELEIDQAQFETVFNKYVIPTLVHWLLGWVLVFLGVLVTASIVPDMLQAGSLHLLLSKPVSRSGLLLSKFVGGCAFVLLCVAQLVIGLVLIAGLRLGIWNPRILWCVPVALVLFSVFFSVSVPAGLKWRSPIISIAAAGALAAVCVVLGVVSGLLDARVVRPDRISSLTTAGGDVFAVTDGGGVNRWNDAADSWAAVIDGEAMSRDRVLSPVTLDADHVVTARIRGGRFNPFGSGAPDLIALSRSGDWQPQPSLQLPTATERLLPIFADQLMAINSAGLMIASRADVLSAIGRDDADFEKTTDKNDASDANSQPSGGVTALLGSLMNLQGGETEMFTSILPAGVALTPPIRVVVNSPATGLLLLTGNRLFRLQPPGDGTEDHKWTVAASVNLPRGDEDTRSVLSASSDFVLCGSGDGDLQVRRPSDLSLVGKLALDDLQPLRLRALAADCFALLSLDGALRVLSIPRSEEAWPDTVDAQTDTLDVSDVEAIHWDGEKKRLWVAHSVDQIDLFELPDAAPAKRIATYRPDRSTWRWIEHYVLGALRWVTPQVLDLGNTTVGMVSGEDAVVLNETSVGEADVARYEIVQPLVSCVLFIAGMMTISCVYFARRDF